MKINFFLCFTSPSISLHFLDSGLKKLKKRDIFDNELLSKFYGLLKH